MTLPLSRLSAPLESRLVNLLRDTPSQVNKIILILVLASLSFFSHTAWQAIPVEKVEGLYFAAHGSNFQRLLEVSILLSLSDTHFDTVPWPISLT